MDVKLMPKEEFAALLAKIPTMTLEQQHKLYVRLRNGKSAIKKHLDAAEAQFKEAMECIENNLLAAATAQGVTGFTIKGVATSYEAEEMRISIADDNAFLPFVIAQGVDGLSFFERRVSSTFVQEYMKENNGSAPPGLNIFRNRVMRVRKATAKPQ